jgi:hypothetical protein
MASELDEAVSPFCWLRIAAAAYGDGDVNEDEARGGAVAVAAAGAFAFGGAGETVLSEGGLGWFVDV